MTTNNKINQFINLTKLLFRLYLGMALSVFLFILFFQPFETEKFEFENKLLFFAGFGLIMLLFLFVSQMVFQSVLVKKKEQNNDHLVYTPLYYFSLTAFTSLAFVFYIRYVGQINITFNLVIRVVIICLSLPVTLIIKFSMIAYQDRLKKLLHEIRLTQDKLKHFSESYANKHIEIESVNESENFRIQVAAIVYVKSADNYVEIGYLDEDVLKKKMVRNTLRNVEQQLAEFNAFIRTHRTSLVNIQCIDKLNKNFNTYWLSLEKSRETIPVSRQYLVSVKELL